MVAIPLAVLAVAMIALLVLLLLYGIHQFANLLAGLLPRINLGFTHIDLGGLVRGAVNYAFGTVEAVFDAAAGPVVNVITAPYYIVKSLFDKVTETIAEYGTTISWIITGYVPGKLDWVFAVISSNVRQLDNSIVAYYRNAVAYVDRRAVWLVSVIASSVAILRSEAVTWYQRANAYTDARAAWLVSVISTNINALWQGIADTYQRAAAYTDARAAWLVSVIASSVQDLRGETAAAIGQVERDITAAANAATAGAIGIISTDIEQAAAAAWGDLDQAVTGAIDVAAGDFADVVARLRAISLADVTDIAGVTALSTAVAGALTRYLEECGMPNCRNLSGVGRALQDLFALFEGGAFLALLATMIADPKGMAAEVESVLGPVAGGIADTARGLLDVA